MSLQWLDTAVEVASNGTGHWEQPQKYLLLPPLAVMERSVSDGFCCSEQFSKYSQMLDI